jgi:hypothetical protein
MLTKTSSPATPPLALERAKAWSCFLLNVLVLPGAGSIMARRRTGYYELGFALLGAAVVVTAFGGYFMTWLRTMQQPPSWGPYVNRMSAGVAMLAVSWVWSFCTGLHVLRCSRR